MPVLPIIQFIFKSLCFSNILQGSFSSPPVKLEKFFPIFACNSLLLPGLPLAHPSPLPCQNHSLPPKIIVCPSESILFLLSMATLLLLRSPICLHSCMWLSSSTILSTLQLSWGLRCLCPFSIATFSAWHACEMLSCSLASNLFLKITFSWRLWHSALDDPSFYNVN